jgi:hypothetical protein
LQPAAAAIGRPLPNSDGDYFLKSRALDPLAASR